MLSAFTDQAGTIRNRWLTALGFARLGRQQRHDDCPESIGHNSAVAGAALDPSG